MTRPTPEPSSEISKIADRIQKLLRLAGDGGATEAEARLAAEKAQELMTAHNLSMAHIEARGGSSGDDGKRVKDGVSHRQVYKWQRTLMKRIAELNFCHCSEKFEYRGRGRANVFDGYDLIGRAANVVSVRTMFEYLVQTIERLAREDVQDPSQFFTRYAHSFKEGCADRIIERLQERREQEVKAQERKKQEELVRAQNPAYASSNAVAVYLGDFVQDENDLNEDMRRGLEPGTTKARRLQREAADVVRRVEYNERLQELRVAMPDANQEELEWRASGFSEETIQRWLGQRRREAKPETEIQRRKRKQQERNQEARDWARSQREQARLDSAGYNRGMNAGDSVGLDKQVDEDRKRRLT